MKHNYYESNVPAHMTTYACFLESGRHFVINAEDDMEAAQIASDYAAWMYDDYLTDLEPIFND